MSLSFPYTNALVGGYTALQFTSSVSDLEVTVNGSATPTITVNDKTVIDLNGYEPNQKLTIRVSYKGNNTQQNSETVEVYLPKHDTGGMGATVIRNGSNDIVGTFFKFWLPDVKEVYVRGSFNDWKDANRLHQLDNSGYWYGFSQDARPGDDYRYYVYTNDNKSSEVSDPAARDTIKTSHNKREDHNDANAVIVDPYAFNWQNDFKYIDKRNDFNRYIIYQCHWGTFLREGDNHKYETFTNGGSEDERREFVRNKLSYVLKLGFTAIEPLPIHEANGATNAGYDPSFFFAVESAYGSPDDLRILVDEAHGLGLAVLFDSVINHLTAQIAHSSFSQEYLSGFYTKKDAPWSNHKQWGGSDWGPDPDYERREIRNLLKDCMRMYFNEFHIDGIRFDATTTIPAFALKPIISDLQNEYGSQRKYLIAEHLTDEPFPYTVGNIGMNASWYKKAFDKTVGNILGLPQKGNINDLRTIFETNHNGEPYSAIKYLLGSHDEVWGAHGGCATITRWGGNSNAYARMKTRLAWALNVCALGTPMLFMGSEFMSNTSWDAYRGYNNGGGIEWNSDPLSFKRMIHDINCVKAFNGALRTNNLSCQLVHYDSDNGIVGYKRWDNNGCVLLIVINISDNQWESREYQINTGTPNSSWHELFNSQYVEYGGWSGSGNSDNKFNPQTDNNGLMQGINVPKWSVMILKQKL